MTRAYVVLFLAALASAQPSFDVASVKASKSSASGAIAIGFTAAHGEVSMTGSTLKHCIAWAYSLGDDRIAGPEWIDSERFDILAKAADPAPQDQLRLMLRSLLAERFKLALHSSKKVAPVYALVVGSKGPKIHEVAADGPPRYYPGKTGVHAEKISMARFAEVLAGRVEFPVIDATGLAGVYDIKLDWSPDETAGPSVFTAVQGQLGLKLEARHAPVEILVVDHVERPTGN